MTKKILFTASIAKHLLRFHLPYLKWFKESGYEVHVACDGDEEVPFTDKKWIVPFVRSPFSAGHMKAYTVLKQIIDTEKYSLIHCHTPMASIVTRLAARDARKKGCKVLYTAHGFHFYDGAPIINWLAYYPIEILLSKHADAIVTINKEDFNRIRTTGHKNTNYFLIPGIGVDKTRFNNIDTNRKTEIRKENGFNKEDFIAVYAAEFIERKNHKFLIETIANHRHEFPNLKLLFCGRGILKNKMESLVNKKSLQSMVLFMGFRNDVDEIYKMSDLGVSSSKQEGLGLNLIEEMMCGLPILASQDRGHKEVIITGENGFLYQQENQKEFTNYLSHLYNNPSIRETMGKKAFRISQKFEITNSIKEMEKIYNKFL